MCTKLRSVHGLVYLRAMLKRIELEKAEFVSQIEEGGQIFIPRDLSQDELPQSFHYYDPILVIVQEMISPNRREFFTLKQCVAFSIHRQNDIRQKILEQMGILDSAKSKKNKLTSKHQALSEKETKEINHNQTHHPLALQRSKYLCVDDSIEKQKVLLMNATKNKSKNRRDQDLNLRFCPEAEVGKNRQRFFVSQAQFYAKLNHLKSNGQKQMIFGRLMDFIESNIDQFSADNGLLERIDQEHQKNGKNIDQLM